MAHFCHPIPIKKSSYLPALSQREVLYVSLLFCAYIGREDVKIGIYKQPREK